MSEIKRYIKKLANYENLSSDEVKRIFQIISLGGSTPAQIASIITAFSLKGISSVELISFTEVINNKFNKYLNLSDLTGIKAISSLNIYNFEKNLIISLIIASFGIKNINYITRTDYSIEFLNSVGISHNINREIIANSLAKTNMSIIPISKYDYLPVDVVETIDDLGIDNIFDLALDYRLMPKQNYYIFKLTSRKNVKLFTDICKELNIDKIFLINNDDEDNILSVNDKNYITEIKANSIENYIIDPSDHFHEVKYYKNINIRDFLDILDNKDDILIDDILLNSAIYLFLDKKVKSIEEGIISARNNISDRSIKEIFKSLVEINNLP